MDFRLQLTIPAFPEKINYQQKIAFIGSCFAENISEQMQRYKFNVLLNPNGILYNPVSIAQSLNRIIDNKVLHEDELFYANEVWNSWEYHSRFSNMDKETCLSEINKSIRSASAFLKQSNWLFITFGSAFVYQHNTRQQIVGNCHRIPQKEFSKSLLGIDEIVETYSAFLQRLQQFNPNIKIVFTVSPVRYIRDGIIENNRSKARLIEATQQLISKHKNTFYFPAYELIIDELRDYRFYKTDMVHPNEQAVEYVFEKLKGVAFDNETNLLFDKIKSIVEAAQHRSFYPQTLAHQKFKTTFLRLCEGLTKEHPSIDLTKELELFKQ